MIIRFTDIEKWRLDKWFRRLSPTVKLCVLWLYENCGREGYWEEDSYLMSQETGVSEATIESEVYPVLREKYEYKEGGYFMCSFLKVQCPKGLYSNNNAHKSILTSLGGLCSIYQGANEHLTRVKAGSKKVQPSPTPDTQETDKDKDPDKDNETDKDNDMETQPDPILEPTGNQNSFSSYIPKLVREWRNKSTREGVSKVQDTIRKWIEIDNKNPDDMSARIARADPDSWIHDLYETKAPGKKDLSGHY